MKDEMKLLRKQLKENIQQLIAKGELVSAKALADQYKTISENDLEIYSIEAVILIMEGKLDDAEKILKKGLSISETNFDLNFNLAYVYEQAGVFDKALDYYLIAEKYCDDGNLKGKVSSVISNIRRDYPNLIKKPKLKIAFFVKQNMDSFLGDIIERLSDEYETKKIVVTEYVQIDRGMEWADVCWFEWCDELVIYGSKLEQAKEKKVICRLHRYEVFTDYPRQVNWENVDKLIVVTNHLKKFLSQLVPNIEGRVEITTVVNGVNLSEYKLVERKRGFNIAYVGYIHSRKNPVLLLQIMKQLTVKDKRYKLYIAGQFQEPLVELYWYDQINKLGLKDNIIFQGWQSDVSKWLDDKNYILSSSIHESFGYGIAEAMAKGIKPVIHDFLFAGEIWDSQYLFRTIDEACLMITSGKYNPKEYRDFILRNYDLNDQLTKIKSIVNTFKGKEKIIPMVKEFIDGNKQNCIELNDCTLLISLFNRSKLLLEDLQKGLKFGNQKKYIVDDNSNRQLLELKNIIYNKECFNIDELMVHDRNKGLSGARNTGIENIKSKKTIILDDDDMLICLNEEMLSHEYNELKDDYIIIIPRYIINLYENGELSIGYDRRRFNNMEAKCVMKEFSTSSEILAMLAGSITNTDQLLNANPNEVYNFAEDFLTLSRIFSNNMNKKILVSENYVHVRRIDNNSLSKTLDKKKLFLNMLSHTICNYYCFRDKLISSTDIYNNIRSRGKLLQEIYGHGSEIAEEIISYLNNEIREDVFIRYLSTINIECKESVNELCTEINDFRNMLKGSKKNPKFSNVIAYPKVSIIIGTYNQKEYLEQAVTSALNQTYPNIEIIVADDNSTDGTDSMMKQFSNDQRVIYYKNNVNLGPGKNHISAFKRTTGEYILFLDHDDYYINDDFISMGIDLFKKNDRVAFVYAKLKYLYEDEGRIEPQEYQNIGIVNGFDYFLNYEKSLTYRHISTVAGSIFRRKIIEESNCILDNVLALDLFIYLHQMLYGDIGFLDEYVGVYRINQKSLTFNYDKRYDLNTIDELEKLKEKAIKRHKYTTQEMNEWIYFRIYKYFRWRLLTLIEFNKQSDIQSMLELVKVKYFNVYVELLKLINIEQQNN